MVTSIVYTLIGLILCFVLYIAFRAINTGMEAKKANKDLESSKDVNLANQEDLPENPKQLEELDENSCKWPIGHPNEDSFYFCGRTSLKDFSYCKLHLLYAFQPKNRKEDVLDKDKDNEVPKFIRRKIKSA